MIFCFVAAFLWTMNICAFPRHLAMFPRKIIWRFVFTLFCLQIVWFHRIICIGICIIWHAFFSAIFSILGNAAVLVTAVRRHSVLKAPELLTVNLAVTDIGMALSMYPLSIASAFNHAWIGGDPSCLYYGLMGMIFSVASIMTLAVMALVRYLVTGNPPKSGTGGTSFTYCIMCLFFYD